MKRKTLLAGILSACIVGTAAAATVASAAVNDVIYGDANNDGNTDLGDVVLIMQALANPQKYGVNGTEPAHITETGLDLADVSERGNGITSNDALTIQRHLLGLVSTLPESYKNGGSPTTTITTTSAATTTTTQTVVTVPQEEVDTKIHLRNSSVTVDGKYAAVNGTKVTISHSGTYTIDGVLDDGQIYIEIPDEKADPDTVKLVLNGAHITGRSAPAILVKNAEKTSITIADGTENTVSDSESGYSGDELESAVIEAKDDLTVKGGDNGTGILNINANIQPAIVCNNDIKITGGILNITTLNLTDGNDAIKGKKSVTVKGGTVNIDAEGDGIKSSKGNVNIEGGTIGIKSGKDAVQAETELNISGGEIAAFGDRGLTCVGSINITGGNLVAGATDNQCENLISTVQPAMKLDFVKEWSKNNPITVADSSDNVIIEKNSLKKFKYAVVSASGFSSSEEYKVFAGGIRNSHSSGTTFRAGNPSSYTDVNNADDAELLYGELFSMSDVHKIDVKMSENDWQNFIRNCENEEWAACDVVIDGVELKNVGIRAKGNSSRMMVTQAGLDKYSFRLKLDKFEKYNNYKGLTEFCMNNMFSDPSCMRDMLCYNAMYKIGGIAPNTAYTNMYLNGNLFSFYLLAEQPGTTLAERLADTDDAVLYKATDNAGGGGGGWGGFGGNDGYCSFTQSMALNNFSVKFGIDDEFKHIADIKQAISTLSSTNYKFIEDIIDVPSFLKGFAINSVMCNYDSYNGTLAHNYYLMYTGGKCYFVGWDYNLALGNFMDYGQSVNSDVKTSLYEVTVADRPLAKLLEVPEYYEMYVGYVNEILDLYSDPEQSVAKFANLIRSHVKADPRSFFTAEQFETNITKSANGLQIGNGGWGGGNWGGNTDWGNNGGNTNWGNTDWGGGNWGGFQFNDNEPIDANNNTFEQSWAFEGGFGGWGGGMFTFGGENISVVDFMIKRFEIIRNSIR